MLRQLIFLTALLWGLSAAAIDIDDVQTQVFDGSCALSGCHNGSAFPDLRTGVSFSAIVNVSSNQRSMLLVKPFDPDNSYLVHKIDDGVIVGTPMPIGRSLTNTQIQLIRDWISEGALEDDSSGAGDGGGDGGGNDGEDSGGGGDSNGTTRARAYLMTRSTSANETTLHIINSSDSSQQFTGTLYAGDGSQLGSADTPLHNGTVASQGRERLRSADLETLFGVEPWSGPAMLEVSGTSGFELMSKLRSPSGLISNTNCVRQDRVHNLEGFDSDNLTFVRLINIGSEPLTDIRGTVTDAVGSTVGTADVQLIAELGAKEAIWLNRNELAGLIGAEWNGTASLTTTLPMPNLRLLNLNFVNGETFFNFSCFEADDSARVYLITNSNSANVSETHFINTGNDGVNLTGTLYSGDGQQLGSADVALTGSAIPSRGRSTLGADNLESLLGTDAWSGPAMLEVSGGSSIELMTKLTSPSGLVSNTNCVRQGSVHNIEGSDSNDRSFVRFINQGSAAISDIRGTLYDASGAVIGTADLQLLSSLAAKAQVWINGSEFESIFGSWNGEATLVVTASDDSDLRLLNLNFANNETFFNFSCYENSGNADATDGQSFFNSNISSPIIQGQCIACHVSGGPAEATLLVYSPGSETDYQATNFNILKDYIAADAGNANTLLEKSRGVDHGGSVQLKSDSDEYRDLVAFLGLLGASIDSANTGTLGAFWQGVAMVSPVETLRRASIIIAGRLPTPVEIASVQSGSDDSLRAALRDLMRGDGFHDFLTTGANDRLFTDAYINGTLFFEGAEIFAAGNFPIGANRFYNDISSTDEQRQQKDVWVNAWRWGLARAPLELIAYIIENDRNYQEIVTADYMMVNPVTSEILNAGVEFLESDNHRVYKPGRNRGQVVRDDQYQAEFELDRGTNVISHGPYIDYPHAGLLNSHAWLNRYPTTETNRNRARSRWTYYHFLGVDIEKSASRTTDPEALTDTDNPTMNNPACTVCHIPMDPVAGTYQNYGNNGIYRDSDGGMDSLPSTYKYPHHYDEDAEESLYQPGDTWFRDMREPGFDSQLAPNADNSLQWLGSEIANDSRFGPAAVRFWWPAIMGANPLTAPTESSDSDYQQRLAAFEEQNTFIDTLGADFAAGINGGAAFNGRDLLVEMLMSPWFRAGRISDDATGDAAISPNIGVRRLLTPQELEAKTAALLGWTWGENTEREVTWRYDGQYTSLEDVYGIYYGDIDSNGIRTRSRVLTSLMANVAEKQAVSMACPAVVLDFARADSARLIFDGIDQSLTPETEFTNDFAVSQDNFHDRATFSASGTLAPGEKRVAVAFTNDYYNEEEEADRNLHLVSIRIHRGGTEALNVDMTDFDEIEGAQAGCGAASGQDYNLWSSCSVSLPFTADDAGTYTVEVVAWADQAGDEDARMRVTVSDIAYVDGNSAGAIAIKDKLIEMHADFLGESVAEGDDELEASYLLLVETWQDRLARSDSTRAWDYPNENCNFYLEEHWQEGGASSQAQDLNRMLYTWTSMLIYFMTDFNYLHE